MSLSQGDPVLGLVLAVRSNRSMASRFYPASSRAWITDGVSLNQVGQGGNQAEDILLWASGPYFPLGGWTEDLRNPHSIGDGTGFAEVGAGGHGWSGMGDNFHLRGSRTWRRMGGHLTKGGWRTQVVHDFDNYKSALSEGAALADVV